jgi:hypothetical protein
MLPQRIFSYSCKPAFVHQVGGNGQAAFVFTLPPVTVARWIFDLSKKTCMSFDYNARLILQLQKILHDLSGHSRSGCFRDGIARPRSAASCADAHDFAFVGLGGDFQNIRHRVALDDERMIARGGERDWACPANKSFPLCLIGEVLPCIMR